MKKIRKKRLLIGVIIAVIGGIMLFSLNHKAQLDKQAELERNREYEVSLVNALKNSYRDIVEIKIPNFLEASAQESYSTLSIEILLNTEGFCPL